MTHDDRDADRTAPAPPRGARDPWSDEPPGADPFDCLIVGGGPAGLAAATYLARFHRRVLVVDRAEGRLRMIPRAQNHAGYPRGVVGVDLLKDMADQADRFGALLRRGEVTQIDRTASGFVADGTLGPVHARTVLLATGVVNHRPPLPPDQHDAAVARGLLRYCPICDAFEQTGKRIGVLGGDRHGLAEAVFLRSYSRDLTLLSLTGETLDAADRDAADRAGVRVVGAAVSGFDLSGDTVRVLLADGAAVVLDTLYVALGSHTRNALGAALGTRLVGGQCFATDDHQRTSVPGVYAAGDAVEGLDQISVAMGTAARAAVAIHNDLRQQDGQTLDD